MALYVREYDWMWTQLGLSLAECRVFAYIYGLTNQRSEASGYRGSKRQLAERLGLNCGATKRILDMLCDKQLITCTDGLWHSVVSDNGGVATDNAGVVSDNKSVVSNNSPQTPLNNNINNNQENSKTPAPTRKEVSEFKMKNNFDIFWAYHNPPKNLRYNKRQCRWLWEDVLDYSVRDQIIDQLMHLAADNRLADERNPYYYLRSFAPREPHNWNGDPSIDSKTRTRLLSAKYHDQFGMYTVEHVLLFGLPVAPDARPLLDAYIAYYHNNHDKKPVTYKVL